MAYEVDTKYDVDVYVWKLEQEKKYCVFDPLASQLEVTSVMRGTVLRWVCFTMQGSNEKLQ
jgi:hypothetical protein